MGDNKTMTGSASFAVSKLGQWTTGRFAELLTPLGLRPRHCAVLEMLRAGSHGQLALARALRVNPSVVVDMVDELERRHAVRRVRDDTDRRRQIVELTEQGRTLADRCVKISYTLDEELLAGLDPTTRAAFTRTAGLLMAARGVPPPE
jgi:DNA-binding MarR family transcriptional regulator